MRSLARRRTVWTMRKTVITTPVIACHRIFVWCGAQRSQNPEINIADVTMNRKPSARANLLPGKRRPLALSKRTASRLEIRRRWARWHATRNTNRTPKMTCRTRIGSNTSDTIADPIKPMCTNQRTARLRVCELRSDVTIGTYDVLERVSGWCDGRNRCSLTTRGEDDRVEGRSCANTSIIFSLVNVEGNRGKPWTDPEELAQRS